MIPAVAEWLKIEIFGGNGIISFYNRHISTILNVIYMHGRIGVATERTIIICSLTMTRERLYQIIQVYYARWNRASIQRVEM